MVDRERAALLAFLRRLLGTYAEREDGTDLLSRGSGTELDRLVGVALTVVGQEARGK